MSGKTGVPFISYASEDRAAALRLASILRRNGFDPWLDVESLLPGEDWQSEIRGAIWNASAFVLLLSSRAVEKRGYIQKEMREALDCLQQLPPGQVFLIPARLEDCSPKHPWILEKQWVDLFPDWEPGIGKLLASLTRLETPHVEPAFRASQLSKPPVESCARPLDLDRLESLLLATLIAFEGNASVADSRHHRVASMAADFAESLGWPCKRVRHVRLGAAVRDIGWIGLPRRVMMKPGPLSIEEREIVRAHPARGDEILAAADDPELNVVRRVVRFHHEKWNGTGMYGLKEADIPEEARLVTLVDVYRALLEERWYKPAFGPEKALGVLLGIQGYFEPGMHKEFVRFVMGTP